jgi:nucleotide-binding universal stress UspA family protein
LLFEPDPPGYSFAKAGCPVFGVTLGSFLSGRSCTGEESMPKDILVKLSDDDTQGDVAADYAISLARTFDAHLTAVAIAYEVFAPGMTFGIATNIVSTSNAQNQAAAAKCLARFEEAARKNGVACASRCETALLADAAQDFGRIARSFDLAVLPQAEADRLTNDEVFIEATLFGSGRPIVVVPYIQRQPARFNRTVCCWDGSAHAARAIADALPFLARAEKVILLTISGEPLGAKRPLDIDMPQNLARNGINVESKTMPLGGGEVSDTILSFCSDVSADFLVMGGYGHSRFREFVLGGATRDILATMTVPVLLSH